MTPVEKAKELLGDAWLNDLEAFLKTGYVISHPDAFLMGKPVPLGADVTDPWERWPMKECSAWFVWAGVGRAARLITLMPFHLPYVGFMRRGRPWKDIHWLETLWFESALAKRSVIP